MTDSALTDGALLRALAEIADGPGAGALSEDVLASVGSCRQIRSVWRWAPTDRQIAIVALAALLAAALIGALMAAGMRPAEPPLRRGGPYAIVLERWNGQVDPDSMVELTAINPTNGEAVRLDGGPRNARNLRWTPDGSRLAFIDAVAEISDRGLGGPHPQLLTTGLWVANGDFTNPVQLKVDPTSATSNIDRNASWAPTGDRLGIGWSTGAGFDGAIDGEIDIFDDAGRPVWAIVGRYVGDTPPSWSQDGGAIGWYPFGCFAGQCIGDSFHWRVADGNGAETVISMPGINGVTWRADGRMSAFLGSDSGVTRLLTMSPDGRDVRDAPDFAGANPNAHMSPDGESLASLDSDAGILGIVDVSTGYRTEVAVPIGQTLAGWSPDSMWIALSSTLPDDVTVQVFSVVRPDGSGYRQIGQGDAHTWAPSNIVAWR